MLSGATVGSVALLGDASHRGDPVGRLGAQIASAPPAIAGERAAGARAATATDPIAAATAPADDVHAGRAGTSRTTTERAGDAENRSGDDRGGLPDD
jgi:hypothetical protein